MTKEIIQTKNAPEAIGTYSQAVKTGNTIYLSGQIALDPQSMQLVEGIEAQIHQVFKNLKSVVEASNASLSNIVNRFISFCAGEYHYGRIFYTAISCKSRSRCCIAS
jgi:reactive intermediate/imine deaminase